MSEPAQVRPMTEGDLPGCVALVLGLHPDFDRTHWVRLFGRDIAEPDKHPLVAVIDGVVVAYARTTPFVAPPDMPGITAPDGYYLLGLNVAPAHRRQGIGRRLTEERLRWLDERTDTVWYFTATSNLASQRLHEQFGFERVTADFTFPDFAPGHDQVLYRRQLTRA